MGLTIPPLALVSRSAQTAHVVTRSSIVCGAAAGLGRRRRKHIKTLCLQRTSTNIVEKKKARPVVTGQAFEFEAASPINGRHVYDNSLKRQLTTIIFLNPNGLFDRFESESSTEPERVKE